MKYLQIKNVKLNNYEINLTLNKRKVYGFFGVDKKTIEDFLLIVNGINKAKGVVLVNGKDAFDNEYYFKSRVFIDFKERYLQSLRSDTIKRVLSENYKLDFNAERFDELVTNMGIRNEATVTSLYKFSDKGTTMVNFAFLRSLYVSSFTALNPTININDKNTIDLITKDLTNINKYDSIFLGLNSLRHFKDKLTEVILFTGFNTIYKIDPLIDSFLLIEDNIYLHDKIYKSKMNNFIICLNNYTKEELRQLSRNKIKYFKKNIYEIEEFME